MVHCRRCRHNQAKLLAVSTLRVLVISVIADPCFRRQRARAYVFGVSFKSILNSLLCQQPAYIRAFHSPKNTEKRLMGCPAHWAPSASFFAFPTSMLRERPTTAKKGGRRFRARCCAARYSPIALFWRHQRYARGRQKRSTGM